ncbi:hypothetical protein [Mycobacterium sp. TY815]|nr:hypothetical protein [Mycobacterium sp. TY815]MDP7702353.1 hypothetical protein [Mycobacterium sp. TY815]
MSLTLARLDPQSASATSSSKVLPTYALSHVNPEALGRGDIVGRAVVVFD